MDQKELREAVRAGEAALRSMKQAREKLGSAKNWGIFDIMGGGLFSSLIKHSRMDDASEYMQDAKRKLAVFERELKDVNVSEDLSLEVGGFLRFADTFLDNVFADVMVQSRINNAIEGLDEASGRVRRILAKLYPLLQNDEEKISDGE